MLSNLRRVELCPASSRGISLDASFCLCTNRKWQPNNLPKKRQKNVMVLEGVDAMTDPFISMVKPTELLGLDFLASRVSGCCKRSCRQGLVLGRSQHTVGCTGVHCWRF